MNKFLITVIIPTIELEFSAYIPNNKKVGTIKKYLLDISRELSQGIFNKSINEVLLIDRDSGKEFDSNMYVQNSGIKNGSKLIFL